MVAYATRRVTGSLLVIGVGLMALSVCTSGAMTMAEMACCADQHGECDMAGHGQSCCTPDRQSGMGMLTPEHPGTVAAISGASRTVVAMIGAAGAALRLGDAAGADPHPTSHHTRSRPRLLSTVLRI